MAYIKQNWSTKTPITPESLNHMEDGIEKNSKAIIDTYSTNEIKTNKVSDDGKPIYRKVMSFSNIKSLYNTNQPIGLNIEKLIDLKAFLYSNNAEKEIFPNGFYLQSGAFFSVFYKQTTNSLAFRGYESYYQFENGTIEVILEYTKSAEE